MAPLSRFFAKTHQRTRISESATPHDSLEIGALTSRILDRRFPTGPLKPRIAASFAIDRFGGVSFDDGLDQRVDLMERRSSLAAKTSKDSKREHTRLDELIEDVVNCCTVKIKLAPSPWIEPPYGWEVVVWAFEVTP